MKRCLDLALLGAGEVAPNPMVGCVIVHKDEIIGEGWHQVYGGPHAEVMAVHSVEQADLLPEATLYVNLEPCSHFGKTPPCADLIVRHHIPRVVIASVDDHSAVAGKGIERLKANGVDVTLGVMEPEALILNKAFFSFHQRQRPYVHLKWACSQDGYMAPDTGGPWISNAYSKRLTHKWRRDYDAILVGRKTALLDDPNLNDRYWHSKPIQRVIIDPELQLPRHLTIFTDGLPTLVVNRQKESEEHPVSYAIPNEQHFDPETILNLLYHRSIQSVLIEGGAHTLQHFLDSGCWDEATVYESRNELHGGLKAPSMDIEPARITGLDDNRILQYYPA